MQTNLTTYTRNASYEAERTGGRIGEQANKIINALICHEEGLTNQELEQRIKLRISSVTARINELRKIEIRPGENLVITLGLRENQATGKTNVVWGINPLYFTPSGSQEQQAQRDGGS